MIKLHTGDVLKCLAKLPDESVQCVVTSPPYWGLRDYGTATWKGGDPACDHMRAVKPSTERVKAEGYRSAFRNGSGRSNHIEEPAYRDVCRKCGARRVDAQLGLEPTPEAFVANMVRVFAEVRRVLRPDGTCWVNLGDSYATGAGKAFNGGGGSNSLPQPKLAMQPNRMPIPGLKPKDLVGIPWRVAFALQADGWYLRSDIIWHKPNPMPESVRDRPTKSHEYLFLLTKRERYYYDADAVREESSPPTGGRQRAALKGDKRYIGAKFKDYHGDRTNSFQAYQPAGRNARSVWTITPKPFKGAHFATFPPALVERCVKAGTSERGVCPTCGAPWERVTERESRQDAPTWSGTGRLNGCPAGGGHIGRTGQWSSISSTLGWRPTCSCPDAEPVPCVVLDPFSGAGTVALVAQQLGRDAIGIDLNPAYNRMARKRIAAAQVQHTGAA